MSAMAEDRLERPTQDARSRFPFRMIYPAEATVPGAFGQLSTTCIPRACLSGSKSGTTCGPFPLALWVRSEDQQRRPPTSPSCGGFVLPAPHLARARCRLAMVFAAGATHHVLSRRERVRVPGTGPPCLARLLTALGVVR